MSVKLIKITQHRVDEEESFKTVSPRHDPAIARMKSQQPWLPQDWALQHSVTDGGGLGRLPLLEELLEVNLWRASHFLKKCSH